MEFAAIADYNISGYFGCGSNSHSYSTKFWRGG